MEKAHATDFTIRAARYLVGLGALVGVMIFALAPARAFETPADFAILYDMSTDTVLLEKNADAPMGPASMTKMMTIHLVFDRLKEGTLSLTDTMPVSTNAWEKGGAASGGSTTFLRPGQVVAVEDLIRGVVVQSGNDASIVLAEGLAGSEESFAAEMTRRAEELGMRNTVFRNSTGWPDPEHVSTVRDLMLLAKATIENFPDYYHYYAEKEFTFNDIKQGNRNPLLYRDIGADGLKTGHTEASGFGLAASAVRGDRRLILVVSGLDSMQQRADEGLRLLEYGFREFESYVLFEAGQTIAEAPVWMGVADSVPLVAEKPVRVTLRRAARDQAKASVAFDSPIPAPIQPGQPVATLTVVAPETESAEIQLVAVAGVERLSLFGRLRFLAGHYVRQALE